MDAEGKALGQSQCRAGESAVVGNSSIFLSICLWKLLSQNKKPRLCEPGKVYFNNYSTKNTKLLDQEAKFQSAYPNDPGLLREVNI